VDWGRVKLVSGWLAPTYWNAAPDLPMIPALPSETKSVAEPQLPAIVHAMITT